MEKLKRNELNLVKFRDIIKLTAFKNGVDESSPYFVSDVLIRALQILAFNTTDAQVVRDACLSCNYISEKNKYPISESETTYIEKMQPFYSVDVKLKDIDNLIRNCRLQLNSFDGESAAKQLKFYTKIRTYLLSVSGELNDLNKIILNYEHKQEEIAEQTKILEERMKYEKESKASPTDVETDNEKLRDDKIAKVKQDLKDGTFEIWCPKCRAKVIATTLMLVNSVSKKNVKRKRIKGKCPIHPEGNISVMVSDEITLQDLLIGRK